MLGQGKSHGAITVINAMPCGIGATIGVDLFTKAVFDPSGNKKVVRIANDPSESTDMAMICVSETYKRIKKEEPEGWVLNITSDIPISRGLKSSSSACNAIVSCVLDSEREYMPTLDRIKLGVECARKAKVTVTGSFDDACGCALGGLVITNNVDDEILFHKDLGDYDVVIYAPKEKIRKSEVPLKELKGISSKMEELIYLAKTDPFKAMTENGRLIASVSGIDNSLSEIALENGALAAGVSGSGPAIAMVLNKGTAEKFVRDLGLTGEIITKTRRIEH